MNPQYGWGLPVAASTYAHDIDFGIRIIHYAMFAIFILWGIFFTYLLVRYRRREGVPAERENEAGHNPIQSLMPDIVVMLFEIGLIAFYAIPVWSRIKQNFPNPGEANQINVIAEQFAWNVQYPGADGKFGKRDVSLVHFSNPIGLDKTDPAAADDVVLANEIHLPLGKLRLRAEGSPGGHNGLKSLVAHLHTTEFPRLRFGVGAPRDPSVQRDYVLDPFHKSEAPVLEETIERAALAVECWLSEGIETAMNRFNG